jgi:hypothetical protein
MAYVAAAAAAQAQALQAEEEESMTPYSREDLAENWEFKFLRSATGKFRDPAFLRAALDEEGKAGWRLVEKFDNNRLRLKRPASARQGDTGRAIDPYRTYVGPGAGGVVAVVVIGTLVVSAGIIGVVFLILGGLHAR